ncbi:MAG: LysR family transcriptional regulator, partial [Pseudomonadota bacterium]
MDWRLIPPLSSLRAYEATLRTGSFSAAGRELNVTHAAISQHVRALEKRLGTALVVKDGLRLVPTATGEKLGEALTEGFSRIASGVIDIVDAEKARPLRVSLTPSFAETWLMPRLGGFWAAHPDIQLEIAPSTKSVDLLRDGFDMAIR